MTIWEILHLDTPTNDVQKIKQAYSKQTKLYNPEENPEKFQEIHNAYKQAIKYAKSQNNTNKDLNIPNKPINFENNNKGMIENDFFKMHKESRVENQFFGMHKENGIENEFLKKHKDNERENEFSKKHKDNERENEFSKKHKDNERENEFSKIHKANELENQFLKMHKENERENEFSKSHKENEKENKFSKSHKENEKENEFSKKLKGNEKEKEFSKSHKENEIENEFLKIHEKNMKENEFSQIYEENTLKQENIESFKEYIIDQNEDELISKIIPIIEFGLKKNRKTLINVVKSSDFQKALKYEKFQFELAKVLINNPNVNLTNIVLVKKFCIKYKKSDSNNKLINSLEKYFTNIAGKQAGQKKFNVIGTLVGISVVIFLTIMESTISSINYDNTANTLSKSQIVAPKITKKITNENEIDTLDEIKIKYEIPKGFKVSQRSNIYKTLKSEDEKVKIAISSQYIILTNYEDSLKSEIKTYKEKPSIYSDVKLTMLDNIKTENYIYNQAEITYNEKTQKNGICRKKETHIWTKVNDKTTVYFKIDNIEGLTKEQLETLLKIEVLPKDDINN